MVPRARPFAALALALTLLAGTVLSGCMARSQDGWLLEAPGEGPADAASTKGWQAGNWWSYLATFEGGEQFAVSLVVFEAADDRFVLGSNLSAGFFGLPFNGTVTRPNLNPVVAGHEWPLFQFPLQGGKEWRYDFFGHTLTARAEAARVAAPGVAEHDGFALDAGAYGQTVVTYTYSPVVEWFTRLVIVEPTDGHEVLRVELLDFGESYGEDYFVSVPVHTGEATYPAAPDQERFTVEGGFIKLTASAVLRGRLGDFRYALKDPQDRVVMQGEVVPQGVLMDRKSFRSAPGTWTVEDVGLGDGAFFLEVTGLRAARDGSLLAQDDPRARALADADAAVPAVRFPDLQAADPGRGAASVLDDLS